MLKKFLFKLVITASFAAAAAAPAMADTATGTFAASMTVAKSCSLDTSNAGIALGVQDFKTAEVKSSSQLGVLCTKNTPYSVSLRPGSFANGEGFGRLSPVSGPSSDNVPIQFYQDVNSTVKWGEAVGMTADGLGTGLAQALTVYMTAATANVEPADYALTINAIVTY